MLLLLLAQHLTLLHLQDAVKQMPLGNGGVLSFGKYVIFPVALKGEKFLTALGPRLTEGIRSTTILQH